MTRVRDNENILLNCDDFDGADKYSKYDRRKKRKTSTIILSVFSICFVCILLKKRRITSRSSVDQDSPSLLRISNKSPNDGVVRRADYSPKDYKYRWTDPRQLPPITGSSSDNDAYWSNMSAKISRNRFGFDHSKFDAFETHAEWKKLAHDDTIGPIVDYTTHQYSYPEVMTEPPNDSSYPSFETFRESIQKWSQYDLDSPPSTIVENLQHFDFQDMEQMQIAKKFRDLELPFKVYNVPELKEAEKKWTDDYLSWHFDRPSIDSSSLFSYGLDKNFAKYGGKMPKSDGRCQKSKDSFFAFFDPHRWNFEVLGDVPYYNSDYTFKKFIKHARYADAHSIPPHEPHYYYQSGIPREERHQPKSLWTFVSRDLPSFSSPEPTFFGFSPENQKGIQCRFGERGVTAATHYDAGRNMVAMIKGAKRYILSPPNDCPKLGIVPKRSHPSFRHSMLNFGHISLLDDDISKDMSQLERDWLNIASEARVIDTVLKAGEVLYIPSYWFHYIISLQVSAQCNTRSGRNTNLQNEFGGPEEIDECMKGES